MVDFEYFIARGEVKEHPKDEKLANLLVKESYDRLNFVRRLAITEENSKYIIENVYDILRELIEAKLALNGFKSYSHEATLLFLKKFPEFKESEIRFIDTLRKTRHGIKYYGKEASLNEAKMTLNFLNSILPKLKRFISAERL